MHENEISNIIIRAAIEIHKTLGPGLLESVYESTLEYKLKKLGLNVKKQVALPVIFEEIKLDAGYRIDLLIENKVIIEIKSVETVLPVHKAQTLTYLKLSELKLALLINFNVPLLKDGIKRFVNNL
ncbi:MAG: GxxExxY protein [Chlorobi bacterium]|nr:GxxExxY protein [Chlorobiota bacterium]